MSLAQPLIGFGRIWHRRLRPVVHEFGYASYFMLLPMRALREQPSGALRRNRFGALSFHDRDHGDGRADALAWLDELLAGEGVHDAHGEVWLHTFPRVLGYVFKPVSFWYAHRADGSLAAVVAEVNNTFGERHCYLLSGPALRWGSTVEARKVFHVSPFCAVDGSYRFRFSMTEPSPAPGGLTAAHIDHHDADGPLLQTSVHGRLEALTPKTARRALWGSPLMSFGVIARIHWQALQLVCKRVPFHRQPSAPERFTTR
ncbi:MAG TPA: DUF1365 domain-containing protein [Rhizobacter sp.]|jgi:hypothetical protein|nr:DUF1365 domain-containing protein [Rhizobacter sp.]